MSPYAWIRDPIRCELRFCSNSVQLGEHATSLASVPSVHARFSASCHPWLHAFAYGARTSTFAVACTCCVAVSSRYVPETRPLLLGATRKNCRLTCQFPARSLAARIAPPTALLGIVCNVVSCVMMSRFRQRRATFRIAE